MDLELSSDYTWHHVIDDSIMTRAIARYMMGLSENEPVRRPQVEHHRKKRPVAQATLEALTKKYKSG